MLTLLIHLGYLGFDEGKEEVFIPNQEISLEFVRAVKVGGWDGLIYALERSEEELKWDKSAKGAIEQIKEKEYETWIKGYTGEILLVGVNYDRKKKVHECVIERYVKG